MRITLVAATIALYLIGSVLPLSAQALMQHYQLNIPRQPLDTALKDFAHQTRLQVARMSDALDGSVLVGPIWGDLSAEEALKSLLGPQGLSYKLVNERTIAILKLGSDVLPEEASTPAGETQGKGNEKSVEPVAQASPKPVPTDQLEDVIVTARRVEEPEQSVPVAVTALSQRDLAQQMVLDVQDLQTSTPGLCGQKPSPCPKSDPHIILGMDLKNSLCK